MNDTENKKNYSIYVVVTCTGTGVAKAIRAVTHMPYSHAAIALDPALSVLYSFSRSYRLSPLPATFNPEVVGTGTLAKFDCIPCEIYSIPLTEEQYLRIKGQIAYFCAFRREFSYSLMGLIWVKLQKERVLDRKFVCSQFVAYVLEECGVELEKPASLYSPDDLRYLPQAELIYRGELNRYYHEMHPFAPLSFAAV